MERLHIYGGSWALQRVRDLMGVVLRGGEVALQIKYIEITPGLLFQGKDFHVIAFPVSHRGPGCFGFIFEEKTRRPFLVEEAERLGVPAGPERRRLVNGESVTLSDGRVIRPDQVLGETVPGTKLVHIGDAARVDNLVEFASGADALVIEATYLSADAELAQQFGHLTAVQAAWLAGEAGVGHLILTHISRRYHGREVLEDARAIFPQTTVANDLDRFTISKRGVSRVVR